MKEHPIIFKTEMVKAILEGKKTQTRRVMNPQPEEGYGSITVGYYHPTKVNKDGEQYPGDEVFGAYTDDGEWGWISPYGQVGDHLWVRETWATSKRLDRFSPNYIGKAGTVALWYKTNDNQIDNPIEVRGKWRPSIHMPRWASRITLEITNIRVQRLQDVSADDAFEEGMSKEIATHLGLSTHESQEEFNFTACRRVFHELWDSINSKRGYSWGNNPFVWVLSFNKV